MLAQGGETSQEARGERISAIFVTPPAPPREPSNADNPGSRWILIVLQWAGSHISARETQDLLLCAPDVCSGSIFISRMSSNHTYQFMQHAFSIGGIAHRLVATPLNEPPVGRADATVVAAGVALAISFCDGNPIPQRKQANAAMRDAMQLHR